MATTKVERLMNLVICLLSTRQFLTAEWIRESVAGYDDSTSHEAFSRMFERDKNELRDLGVPLETGTATRFGGVEGYRINRDAYELPDIDLTSEESAAVAVAVKLWESPELTSAAQSALLKLRAAGIQVDQNESAAAVTAVPARTRGSEPALGALLAAIDDGKSVRFQHRPSLTEPFTTRTVEPWGVVTFRGRWYLVGHDVDRDDTRTFRLSRIGDEVKSFGTPQSVRKPDGVDLQEIVRRVAGTSSVSGTARVWLQDGRALELRRMGTVVGVQSLGTRSGTVVEVPVRSWDWVSRLIAGHGADAVVLEPAELRADVISTLQTAADVENQR
ncbi:YafY family transcriptional regulator [Rhodococcus sp. 15-725-2-2b]|uniref:helix-turn-helix transcriptional regulator n=1 Tax=Nocardiaceae TaxID=85025 RepID=UPI00050C70C0|nr:MULTISPECIES: YafY family protein [Rhodococcus]AJW39035.1 DeoR-family transcriptional regulator [Rhodococcus sp. B7740]OZC60831.1 YafY family transcriptional regulator [Rhodococcus sp. 06-470-2]OZC71534.1 YafY family transcriptional regulator [Rhodococcus sp. 06-469-3-2]OZC83057.1 YafY family transcriptional regulator [Rhodococcus sp. 06-418-5]OZD42323.1 YafY family transcriptional regulator [Rhodococcus sp. 06-1477-1A]